MIAPEIVSALIRKTAAAVILPRFRALAANQIREKKPGDLVTIADVESEAMLERLLTQALPGSVVCGEEGVAQDPARLLRLQGDTPVWVIDPVDGTANFAHGNTGFAVIVALVANGTIMAGWIHEPCTGTMVHATRGGGAWIDGNRVTVESACALNRQSGSAYGRLETGGEALKLLAQSGAVACVRNTGCCGLDYILMARGETHFKYCSVSLPWDHAAGMLIMAEAGATARFADGSPYSVLRHNGPLLIAPSQDSWHELSLLLSS